MFCRRIVGEVAVLALICVVSTLLFPSLAGPYSATHGPVTVLQSVRGAVRVRAAIQWAAQSILQRLPLQDRLDLGAITIARVEIPSLFEADFPISLRC